MSHPFEEGKTYRNRVGEYVVQSIEGDRMTIKYVGGGTLETTVHLQARIWENIHFEEQMAREEERVRLAREARRKARKRAARARRAARRPKFGGFEEADFEPKKRGIAWSSRKELGKVLAYNLSQSTGNDFGSWIVPRKSGVNVAEKDVFNRDVRDNNVTFFVSVGEQGVAYGLRVGKADGKAKAKSPWKELMKTLAEDDKIRRAIRASMKAHELVLDVYAMDVRYGMVGQAFHQKRDFLWEQKSADQDLSRKMDWSRLIEHLEELGAKRRCNLYLRKRIEPEEAIEAGPGAAEQITAMLTELMPVYEAVVS
jgi:hypothetical protein